ncbi:dihydropteroate synthase [Streptomyces sp. TLI_235]|nr:dihydropteroate synthase [Streptomyces sp. TLI_235]
MPAAGVRAAAPVVGPASAGWLDNGPMDNPLPGLPTLDRCAVMGVVNVTPDSFSDGGLWLDPAAAVAHGLRLTAQGADLIDVGGESTRPGAQRVTEAEELRRVVPVVRELAAAGAVVSVDTMRASVAAAAVEAGARLVNDVSGGLADQAMAEVVAATGAPFVVMHWRGQSADMDSLAVYDDVVADVTAELTARVAALLAAGVKEDQLVLDPGLGFAKTSEHNWALLGRLDALIALGRPVLVAASRKRFLGTLLANPESGELRPARQRDDATAAISVLSARAGAWAVRVHDVAGTADAVRVVAAWQQAARRG